MWEPLELHENPFRGHEISDFEHLGGIQTHSYSLIEKAFGVTANGISKMMKGLGAGHK